MLTSPEGVIFRMQRALLSDMYLFPAASVTTSVTFTVSFEKGVVTKSVCELPDRRLDEANKSNGADFCVDVS